MIDYELFKRILSQDDGYIEDGDFLDYKTVQLLVKYPITKINPLFKKVLSKDKGQLCFFAEAMCSKCGSIFSKSYTKTTILTFFSDIKKGNEILCDKCAVEKEKQEKAILARREELYREEVSRNTEDYICKYLDPEKCWKNNTKHYQRWRIITGNMVDSEIVAKHIKEMDYYDFLKTPYWKAVADRVKYRANFKCQICNSSENLNVHHRTYDNHGKEIYHLGDLICLCKACHEKHHFE